MPDHVPPSPNESTNPLPPPGEGPEAAGNHGTIASPSPLPPAWATAPDAPEHLNPPEGGRYRPHSFHKPGGMGRVWRARDTEIDRDVAFKEIRPKYVDDATARDRFVFEAEVTGRLEHPAVIPVYGFGRDADGRPYYAMRFVEGQSLRESIAEFYAPGGPSGADRAVALRRLMGQFVTVCRAVDYAHSRGVIHRDLKPANIMVGAYGETLVVDWGIAKRLRVDAGESEAAPTDEPESPADPVNPNRSLRGLRLGSPGYWSPEQAAGRPDLHDERTDVYGLGSILFAILTGSPPHPRGTHPNETQGPQSISPWVDAGIDEITRRAMALDPNERYGSAAEVAAAVEVWLADQPVLAQRGAVAALERAAGEHPGDFALVEQLARQCSNLGLMLAGMHRNADAVAEFRAAADAFARLANARNKPRFLADQANVLLALARALAALNRSDEAKTAEREAAGIYRRLIATRPDEYKANVAEIMLTWAGAPPPDPEEPALESGPVTRSIFLPPTAPSADLGGETRNVEPALPEPVPDAVPVDESEITAHSEHGMAYRRAEPEPREDEFMPASGYTILSELGRGGMSRVFLARDNALGRQVAIKTLLDQTASDASYVARFRLEMQITAALEHPNLVRLYSCGEGSAGRPFMVLEYVKGESLRDVLRARGPGWSAELLGPLAQACDGLHYAHSRGIVQRDAKLANIVVRGNGQAVVFDWSIAKIVGRPDFVADRPIPFRCVEYDGASLTQTGAVMGTPAYMAPEQARGEGNSISPRTDVFSLGACLFNLVTDRYIVQGGTAMEFLVALATGDIPRLRDVRPDVPPQLDAICSRAMAFRPEDRHPTAAALAADIRAFLDAEPDWIDE